MSERDAADDRSGSIVRSETALSTLAHVRFWPEAGAGAIISTGGSSLLQ